jgi:hypothetical protein
MLACRGQPAAWLVEENACKAEIAYSGGSSFIDQNVSLGKLLMGLLRQELDSQASGHREQWVDHGRVGKLRLLLRPSTGK